MKKLAIIFILFFVQNFYSQEANIKHIVSSGETLSSIAQKYKVTPYDIVKLNPNAVNGVKESDVLVIPKARVTNTAISNSNSSTDTQNSSVPKTISSENRIHIVQSKETKFGLSKLYGVTIQQLEEQNPQIVAGLQVGHKLQINGSTTGYKQDLSQVNVSPKFDSKFDYVVLPGETLYGISKRNGITVDELTKANASVLNGVLKSGQKLTVPTRNGSALVAAPVNSSSETRYHLVEPKETKFGLSKKYGVTIAELENGNPQIVKGLQIGQKISIPSSYKGDDAVVVNTTPKVTAVEVESKPQTENTPVVETKPVVESSVEAKPSKSIISQDFVDYQIQPKETLFGLSKRAGMTVKEFTDLNPKLADAVQVGMVIKMPKNASSAVSTTPEKVNQPISEKTNETTTEKVASPEKATVIPVKNPSRYKDLYLSIDKSTTKELALVMPFSDTKYQEFVAKGNDFKEVSDKFVKGNLEFYSGALKAIDSAKSLGVAVNVKLLELQDNPTELALDSLSKNEVLVKSNLIMMPYFEKEAPKIAAVFNQQNIPVVTTKSIIAEKGFSNLFVSLPSEQEIRTQVLNYLSAANANIIVVNSSNRLISKSSILEKFPQAKWVKVSDKNVVDTEDLKTLLVKDKLNYVILDTDKNSMIISSTNVLLNQSTEFSIQIAVLEPSLLANYENVSSIRINILKMIYPTYISVEKAAQAQISSNSSKKKTLEQNQNYLTGFDVTFDVLLRLSQNKDFETSTKEDVTEYSKFKFEYHKNQQGTSVNEGFYILQHDTDNTIKELGKMH